MTDTKDVTSGVVSTIGDNDLVMVAASGGWHPIKFADLAKKVRETMQIGGRNLIRGNVYDNSIPGARATNGVKIHHSSRFSLTTGPIKEEGQYAVSFWAKADTPLSIMIDINDCGGPLCNVETEWSFYTAVIRAYQHIGKYGFFDIATTAANDYKVTVSDIVVVKGNTPVVGWFPAPEDIASGNWGGVNQRFTTTYKSEDLTEMLVGDCLLTVRQKGGAHDTDQRDNGCVQGCADGSLAFGTVYNACEWIGTAFKRERGFIHCQIPLWCESGYGFFGKHSRRNLCQNNRNDEEPSGWKDIWVARKCYLLRTECLPDVLTLYIGKGRNIYKVQKQWHLDCVDSAYLVDPGKEVAA